MFRLYSGGNCSDNSVQCSLVTCSSYSGDYQPHILSRTVLQPLFLSLMLILGAPLSLFATPQQLLQGGIQGFTAPGRDAPKVVGVVISPEDWGFSNRTGNGAPGHNADQTQTGTTGDSGGGGGSHTAGDAGVGDVQNNGSQSNGFTREDSFDLTEEESNNSGEGSRGNSLGFSGLQQ